MFRVQGLGFRVQGLGFRVQGRGFLGLGFRVSWGFPRVRGILFGVPIIRMMVFWVYEGVPS